MLAKLVITWRFLRKWGFLLLSAMGGILAFSISPDLSGQLIGGIPIYLVISPDFFQGHLRGLGKWILQALKERTVEERGVLGGLVAIIGIAVCFIVGMGFGLGVALVEKSFLAGLFATPGFIGGLIIMHFGGSISTPGKFERDWGE